MCKRCLEAIGACPELLTADAEYMPAPREDQKKIYFIARSDLNTVKIGQSYNPKERLKILQQEEYQKLILLATYPMLDRKLEYRLHKYFEPFRVEKRREWFYFHYRICGFMKGLWLTYHCGMTFDEVIDIFRFEPDHTTPFRNH